MYCPKCGTQNPENATLCSSCSWLLAGTSVQAPHPNARTSGLAIAAFVLGILSFFTCLVTTIPAIILGIVAMARINSSRGALKGTGMAIAGIAIPVACLPLIGMSILMPALAKTKVFAQRKVCTSNMRALGIAMALYADDFDDKYPDPSKWCDLLIQNTNIDRKMFICKSSPTGPCSYAMNENIVKLGSLAPPDMVLLFETSPGWNQSGGPEILTTDNHSRKSCARRRGCSIRNGCNILFNDNRVKFVRAADIPKLRWTAKQNE